MFFFAFYIYYLLFCNKKRGCFRHFADGNILVSFSDHCTNFLPIIQYHVPVLNSIQNPVLCLMDSAPFFMPPRA